MFFQSLITLLRNAHLERQNLWVNRKNSTANKFFSEQITATRQNEYFTCVLKTQQLILNQMLHLNPAGKNNSLWPETKINRGKVAV